ncbi:hypothetical protein [Photorhabdus sp. SF281]|uniref:hypothetical protein n=1 Tax=Photorhabdus sp. SF281 TaxID=3459527 RepID=UPI004044538A
MTDSLSHSICHFSCQHFVSVFRYPHKMVFNLKYRVAAISVIHVAPPVQHNIAAKAGGFNLSYGRIKSHFTPLHIA